MHIINPRDVLGKVAKDKITGFTGVISAVAFYVTGCTQCAILPQTTKDGAYPEGVYLDEGRLELQPEKGVSMDDLSSKEKEEELGFGPTPPRC